jgi:diguanylate cyclase (GGDEF)-like protein
MASILVVEDDQAIAQMIKLILSKQGHALRHVVDGRQALSVILEWLPDLIISDVMMPGMDGFAMAEQLQKSELTRSIPIVFVTAMSQTENLSHGLNLGAVDYITKPFRALELEARVRSALRLKIAQDDLRRANAELTDLAMIDSLTELKNPRFVNEYLTQALPHSARYGEPLSILMIDLDFFKKVNDTHGHLVGNDVLKELAGILRTQARQADAVCRYGGEEFLVICPNTSLSAASLLGERLRSTVACYEFPGVPWTITVSIGIATYEPKRDRDANALIARADSALYLAKNEGRNVVREAP